jgi:tight adherence protein B
VVTSLLWAVASVALAGAAGGLLPDGRRRAVLRRLGALGRAPRSAPPRRSRHRLVRFPRRRVGARTLRAEVGELLDGLVAELRAGADPRPALLAASRDLPGLAEVTVAAGQPAGDVGRALDDLGERPGGSTAADLAAAWRVAERTGCGLAAPAERLLEVHRDGERLHLEVAAQLAGPVATARLLCVLPLAGVAMGSALGADPVRFLTATGPGLTCLAAGLGLLVLGVRWTVSIAASVTDDWTGERW